MPRFTLRSILAVIGVVSVYLAGWSTASLSYDQQIKEKDNSIEWHVQREHELEQAIVKKNRQLIELESPCEPPG